MTQPTPFSLFDGTDTIIENFFGLSDSETIDQLTACRRVNAQKNTFTDYEALVSKLYNCIEGNRSDRTPSIENWRLDPVTTVSPQNKSPEVLLERAIALLATQGHLSGWYNQIPVASGLINESANKRTAIDLLYHSGKTAEFIELKWASNTPLFAAMEILRYGLAYLYSYVNQTELGYDSKELMHLQKVTLSVLAPANYYADHDLVWLIQNLNEALQTFSRQKTNGSLSIYFKMTTFTNDFTLPFMTGADVMDKCDSKNETETTRYLVDALNNRQSIESWKN